MPQSRRTRTAAWNREGGVALCCSWKRDHDSLLARCQRFGITPIEERHPYGYVIRIAPDQAVSFPQLIRPKRTATEGERQRMRNLAAKHPLHP